VSAPAPARRLASVEAGEVLPETSISLSVQRLVMIAAANRDFAPTHHDAEAARATGAGNPYGNMMFVTSMFERAVLGWAGPGARLRRLRNVRMMAFNEAGMTISCHGVVTSVDPGERRVRIELWLATVDGRRTSSAEAEIEFPA
jgi:acyl dehydratase